MVNDRERETNAYRVGQRACFRPVVKHEECRNGMADECVVENGERVVVTSSESGAPLVTDFTRDENAVGQGVLDVVGLLGGGRTCDLS